MCGRRLALLLSACLLGRRLQLAWIRCTTILCSTLSPTLPSLCRICLVKLPVFLQLALSRRHQCCHVLTSMLSLGYPMRLCPRLPRPRQHHLRLPTRRQIRRLPQALSLALRCRLLLSPRLPKRRQTRRILQALSLALRCRRLLSPRLPKRR